jgi:CDP-glucose 4,6-dehydratase
MVTTDKCYENKEDETAYHEEHPLGGHDPYSSSKAMAEIAVAAYRRSYFFQGGSVHVATARAGNVIGGGDWADDRIVPDAIRALEKKEPILVRNPSSVRPWQHVLEALSGYLVLALKLSKDKSISGHSFNFSSNKIKNITVLQFLKKIKNKWPIIKWSIKKNNQFYESSLLQLDTLKANSVLNWKARLSLNETIEFLVNWYKNYKKFPKNIFEVSRQQINEFMKKKS